MSRIAFEETFRFRGNTIHKNIVKDFMKQYPEYSTEADALRHGIVLLDEKMRKGKGVDDLSVLKEDNKKIVQSMKAMQIQNDVLIKLNIELLSRLGSDLSIEDVQQEVKNEIASSVTRKAEAKFSRTSKRDPLELRKGATVKEEKEIQQEIKASSMFEKKLPMVTDKEEILLINDKPYKKIYRFGKFINEEIEWEQIPEHRLKELE
ncbi:MULTISPECIES: hypothetical protein [Bacillus cereus group]|uniref:Uncharacterized protein n=1 Tax=Bacillus cereus TaxID=1396 RepID=A0A1Q4L4A0_BACCE|nr:MULTISPECIES: hypothetical protein [Bacillus cereus group]EJP83524.1 hypothetical protein IAU_05504 [Bacillus cereus IS075]EOO82407.1 hypothetical protein IGS_05764 [Bacillus cereus IS845/00]EOO92590.1 hypothetical protein IGQ_05797 [Bacillus cereus IS195]MCU5651615.1 hypothetical protein [Bacillus cereus]MDX5927831.1 hypothetical protein [Bacillus cereus group sp. BfR-BA-00967]